VETGWGTQVAVRYIRAAVRSVGLLDLGEQAVLTLALRRPGSRVVLDDAQARRAAQTLGIPLIGTLGVIVLAKRQQRTPAIAPLFHAIRVAGCYVDDDLLRQLAMNEGEAWP
jgi:predicted nucleic acid-binding protein